MLYDFLNKYSITLGSSSPRRQALLKDLGINYDHFVSAIKQLENSA